MAIIMPVTTSTFTTIPIALSIKGKQPVPNGNTPAIEDITPIIPTDEVGAYALSEFRYIHVAVTDAVERGQIHKTICNIVRLPKMQQICDELYRLMKDKRFFAPSIRMQC